MRPMSWRVARGRRFSRWAKSGVWERVFQHLAADADNEYAMIDSTIVRAHQHSAGAQKKSVRTRRSGARRAGAGAVGTELIACLEQRDFPLRSLRLYAS